MKTPILFDPPVADFGEVVIAGPAPESKRVRAKLLIPADGFRVEPGASTAGVAITSRSEVAGEYELEVALPRLETIGRQEMRAAVLLRPVGARDWLPIPYAVFAEGIYDVEVVPPLAVLSADGVETEVLLRSRGGHVFDVVRVEKSRLDEVTVQLDRGVGGTTCRRLRLSFLADETPLRSGKVTFVVSQDGHDYAVSLAVLIPRVGSPALTLESESDDRVPKGSANRRAREAAARNGGHGAGQ